MGNNVAKKWQKNTWLWMVLLCHIFATLLPPARPASIEARVRLLHPSSSRLSGLSCGLRSDSLFWQKREESDTKKYLVTLTPKERQQLSGLIDTGKSAAHKLVHARILLKIDQTDYGPAWPDARIVEVVLPRHWLRHRSCHEIRISDKPG
jgi:hypothetical protein